MTCSSQRWLNVHNINNINVYNNIYRVIESIIYIKNSRFMAHEVETLICWQCLYPSPHSHHLLFWRLEMPWTLPKQAASLRWYTSQCSELIALTRRAWCSALRIQRGGLFKTMLWFGQGNQAMIKYVLRKTERHKEVKQAQKFPWGIVKDGEAEKTYYR